MEQPQQEALSTAILLGQQNRNILRRGGEMRGGLPAEIIGRVTQFLHPYGNDPMQLFPEAMGARIASSIENLRRH